MASAHITKFYNELKHWDSMLNCHDLLTPDIVSCATYIHIASKIGDLASSICEWTILRLASRFDLPKWTQSA